VRGLRAVQDLVLASCGDGTLAALRAADGAVAWSAGSGGEVIGRAAPFRDMIVFGSGDGTVRAVGLDGRPKWTVEAGAPVYASPLALDDRVIVGTTAGTLCALDAAGRVLWKARVAGYAIESSFACDGERVFLGAWDEHVHAVSVKDGSVAWKQKGDGSAGAKAAKRYYSPADCGPALASGRLFVADRAYRLTRLDAATGAVEGAAGEISAVGPTEDGKGFLVRRTTDGVARLNPDGSVAWSVAADTDAVPAAPVERRGVVYVCSSTGLLTGLAAGKVLWRAQVAPMAYVLASPEPGDKHVFVGCQDGGVTAVELP
jgi:outer membrane protein assembly factor BamB